MPIFALPPMPFPKSLILIDFRSRAIRCREVGKYRASLAFGQADSWEGGSEAEAIEQLKSKLRQVRSKPGFGFGWPKKVWGTPGSKSLVFDSARNI